MDDDIAGGIDTSSTIRPDSFVYGALETEGDHDWHQVDLDVGRYVITLTGSGSTPVGDPVLAFRDPAGNEVYRSDDYYFDSGASRLDITASVRAAIYLDVSGDGPFIHPEGSLGEPGTVIGDAVGDYALIINRVTDSPLEALDWGTKLTQRKVDVYFMDDGETATGLHGAAPSLESDGWNRYEARQAMAALDAFSAVCDLTFERTRDRSDAEFTLLTNAAFGEGGFLAAPGTIGEGVGVFGAGRSAIARDDWAEVPGGALEEGGYGWQLLLHEFGHGLGLAHPHDEGLGASVIMDGVTAPDDGGKHGLNSYLHTVMSYRGYGAHADEDGRSPSGEFGYVAGPMAFDIALLQEKYGANVATGAGDDIYRLPDANEPGAFYACIWDSGGTDRITAGSASESCRIDLNDATLRYERGGGGVLSSVEGVFGGLTIANGVTIEDAMGGAGADELIGNAARNALSGRAGDDRIQGGGGKDDLLGGAGEDSLRGGRGGDRIAGGRNADKLRAGRDDAQDVFVFEGERDSGTGRSDADRIYDFDRRNGAEDVWDRIDLSALDGGQGLRFVEEFTEAAGREPEGQVRVLDDGANVEVLVDLDGDREENMAIRVMDVRTLTADDFIL